ncbi:unnamed protein product [Ophioblennius macclurei]
MPKISGVFVESRRHVRGLRRNPVRVLFPGSEAEKTPRTPKFDPEEPKATKKKKEEKVTCSAPVRQARDPVWTKGDPGPGLKQDPGPGLKQDQVQVEGIRFERAFPGDKRLGRLVSIARSRTFREHQGKILLEGRRLICDALDAGANPQMVFFSTLERLQELPLDRLRRATLVKVKFEDIKLWSDVTAPQGVIAIFSRPDPSRMNFAGREQSLPLSLVCDNVRDPGNLGTMLRCAVAAGCHSVLLTKGCVDAWEPKVLRAAMGAHFRLPIFPNLDWSKIPSFLPKHVSVHVADSGCAAPDDAEAEVNAHRGSKAGDHGWVARGRTLDYEDDSDSDSDEEGAPPPPPPPPPNVEAKLYHQSWAQGPAALVIGGETHGLSAEALRLAETTSGSRLFIPVAPGVDSLNSAMAASVLLFEGRRQLMRTLQTSGRKRLTPEAERRVS